MKWGLKRPIVYFAISVIKTVVTAPKPNIPIWNIENETQFVKLLIN